ncbi:replication protein [Desulfosporosinus sp. OT]|uniref:replication protein n=1 Tax=Desulfosporosinus sp. OT TaxID=913865 RepID=UPI0009FF3F17|nr:replication protein [Desulfosporosinus sp. OT]
MDKSSCSEIDRDNTVLNEEGEEVADVQIDSGDFTRIANVLLENIARLHLNGTQYSIVLTVWRFTYGFQRKEHDLSITFIANATGISGRSIKKELKVLIDRNILLVTKESTKAESRTLKFNKDYESWIDEGTFCSPEQGNKTSPPEQGSNCSPGEQNVPCEGSNSSPQQGSNPSPKKESKDNLKKDIYIVFSHWNSKKIITHKTLTEKIANHINARLKEGYSDEEIIAAIDNYEIILRDNANYFWTYKWGLSDFLVRGLDKFKTESDPFTNYANKGKTKGPPKPNNKAPSSKYEKFYL